MYWFAFNYETFKSNILSGSGIHTVARHLTEKETQARQIQANEIKSEMLTCFTFKVDLSLLLSKGVLAILACSETR